MPHVNVCNVKIYQRTMKQEQERNCRRWGRKHHRPTSRRAKVIYTTGNYGVGWKNIPYVNICNVKIYQRATKQRQERNCRRWREKTLSSDVKESQNYAEGKVKGWGKHRKARFYQRCQKLEDTQVTVEDGGREHYRQTSKRADIVVQVGNKTEEKYTLRKQI